MSAPSALTVSGRIALTVAAVPTGMKAGVRMTPRDVVISPSRAEPSTARTAKETSSVMPTSDLLFCPTDQEAGVAVGIEAITRFDRMRIGRPHALEPAEGADEHEERRARQMEIGQKGVDRAEAVARRNEDRGLAGERPNAAALVRRGLDKAGGGRAYADDAPAALARGVQRPRRRLIDRARFSMHPMVARVLGLDGQERSSADVQRHAKEPHAPRRNPLDQRGSEMESRGRRRDSARLGREHRLVVGPIPFLRRAARGYVGRQRRRSQPFNRLVERRADKLEAQQDFAGFALFLDFGVQRREQAGHAFARLAEADALADLKLLGGSDQRAPAAVVDALDEGRFDCGGRIAPDANAVQPRCDDAGVVDHQRVSGPQEIGQVGDAGVRQIRVGPDDEHPRAVARRYRLERNPLRREFEIEGVDAHRRLGLSFPHLRDVGGENSRPTPLSDQLFGRKTVHHQNANRRKDHTAPTPAPARQLKVALTILSGSLTGSPRLILSTFSMPETTLPQTVYWRSRKWASSKQMKNCELAELGLDARAIDTVPRTCGSALNSAWRSGYFDPPVPL